MMISPKGDDNEKEGPQSGLPSLPPGRDNLFPESA